MEKYEFKFDVTPDGVTVSIDGDPLLIPYGETSQVFKNLRAAGIAVEELKKTLPRKLSSVEKSLERDIQKLVDRNAVLSAEINENNRALSELRQSAKNAMEDSDPESESNRREAATRRSV